MRSLLALTCRVFAIFVILATPTAVRGEPAAPTLKSILLEQLRGTHNQEEWFVPVKIAIEGLTPEQAVWKEPGDNH